MPIGAIAAGVGLAGSIGGSIISSNAAKDASKTQSKAADKALATQKSMFDVAQANQQPFMDIGKSVLPTLSQMISGGANSQAMLDNLKQYPGYQFALQQGQNGLDADLAKMGSRVSGNAIAGGINYNQNAATTLFDGYFNHLTQLAGIGSNAAAISSTNAMNAGTTMGNTEMAKGEAVASGQAAVGNIWGNVFANTLPSIAGQVAGAYTSAKPAGSGNASSNYNTAIFSPGKK